MSQSQKHFDYLQEMGISLWQRRDLPSSVEANTADNANDDATVIDIANLFNQSIFTDILLFIGTELADVEQVNQNTLNVGQFEWQFSKQDNISFTKNLLKTPRISELNKPAVKHALYQVLVSHQLV